MTTTTDLHDTLAAHVERGDLPGLVALVARHDGSEPEVVAIGTRTFGDAEPIGRDAIFRIASLTKPITAAVTMTLVEDGTLRLDDPVDDLLPELANRRVLPSLESALDDTVPAARSITVEDLLTFRMGLGVLMAPPDTYPIQSAEAGLELRSFGPPWPPTPYTPDEWIAALGSLPLMHQPGEVWQYNTGAQVLGVLVARAAGKPLGEVFRERILDPLGMVDTGFHVPADKLGRFTTAYQPQPDGTVAVHDPVDGWYATPPRFPDASAWLTSTVDDYWAFASMLLAGGGDVLSEASVRLMTTDHLTAEQRAGGAPILDPGAGWGFGLQVADDGTYGWDGGSGTTWRTDVARGVTGILLTQRQMVSPEPPPIFTDFSRAAFSTQ